MFSRESPVFSRKFRVLSCVFSHESRMFSLELRTQVRTRVIIARGGQWRSVSVLSTLQLGYRFCEKKAVDYKDYKTFVQA